MGRDWMCMARIGFGLMAREGRSGRRSLEAIISLLEDLCISAIITEHCRLHWSMTILFDCIIFTHQHDIRSYLISRCLGSRKRKW
jgi:hypothetical protein